MDKIKAKVIEIKEISERIKIFKLNWEGIEKFNFKAGQFINLSDDNFKDEEGKIIKRPYSIANSPLEKKYLELCIAKGQKFSKHLFEKIKKGDILNVEGPFGIFFLKETNIKDTESKLVFIAGGTGIAPLISMIRTLIKQEYNEEINLFYSIRNSEDYAYKEELENISKQNKKFKLIMTCTRTCNEWKGKTGRITTFIEDHIKKNWITYICGPKKMAEDISKILGKKGVDEEKKYCRKIE